MIVGSEAKEIQCSFWTLEKFGIKINTCFLKITTIEEPGATVSEHLLDSSATGLYYNHNDQAHHLLDKVVEKLPNLVYYSAEECSVKEISKRNFNGLVKLRFLNLKFNRIEKIANDTFQSLINLEFLSLCEKN